MKFLGRAKRFLQDLGTDGSARTQTFNLSCASGHRVRGERTEGYQALRCPSCGEGVFVLPRSPMPEPVAPAGASPTRGATARPRSPWADEGPIELTDHVPPADDGDEGRSDGPEVYWDEGPGEAPPRPAATAAPRVAPEDLAAEEIDAARRAEARAAGPEPARPARSRPRPAAREAAPPPESSPARTRPRRPAAADPILVESRPMARRGPRLGLIFASLAALIVLTIGWRMWRSHRAQYPLIAERGREEGIPALEAGEFEHANQLLSAARSAVDALGGAVEGADDIRQAAEEAAIYVDLCPRSLEELLDDAARKGSDEWADEFDKLYKGRHYIFDTFIQSTPGATGAGAYELGYVVFPPGEATRFGDGGLARPDRFAGIDLAGFELFESLKPTSGTHVTFGARLQSIAYDGERKQWMVRLEPRSGVIITHHAALRTIGWPEPEAVELPKEGQP